jgi:ElaB/YqjD/DUF883 family membrane-anchored ribosome-binding protein
MQTKHRNSGTELTEHAHNVAEEIQATGAAALTRAKDMYQTAQNGVVNGVKTADKAIRQNPYPAVGIAFGVGLLIGFLVKKK